MISDGTPIKELLCRKNRKDGFWTKELECADCRKIDEHGDELVDKEVSDSYVPYEELSSGPTGDHMTISELEEVMEDNTKTRLKWLRERSQKNRGRNDVRLIPGRHIMNRKKA